MSKNQVLVIESSMIKSDSSFSRELCRAFVDCYRSEYLLDEIIYLDLNEITMAQKTLNSKNFATFFNESDSDFYINQLKSAYKLIISTPMTNFNYPATLKNYLDHILVADKTFSYKYSKCGGSIGLLTNLKVQILATQGAPIGWYEWGNHIQMLVGTWRFVGAKVYDPLVLDGTKVFYKNCKPVEVVKNMEDKIKMSVKQFK